MRRTTGLLTLTQSQFANLKSLFFNIGGVSYELTPNAQIWPRALNSTLGGDASKIYLIVSDLGSPSGQGLDFISACTAPSPPLALLLFALSVCWGLTDVRARGQTGSRSCSASTACTIPPTRRSGSRPRSSRTPRRTEREPRAAAPPRLGRECACFFATILDGNWVVVAAAAVIGRGLL